MLQPAQGIRREFSHWVRTLTKILQFSFITEWPKFDSVLCLRRMIVF